MTAALLALVLGVAGLLQLSSRDDATTRTGPVPGTLVPAQDGQDSQVLRAGNVILVAGRGRVEEARTLATELAGAPTSRALASAGQAVIVQAGPGVGGIVAVAYEHQQRAEQADDPELRRFVEYWLGRGA